MSGAKPLNINAASQKQIKEHLHCGASKATAITTKRSDQPGNRFT